MFPVMRDAPGWKSNRKGDRNWFRDDIFGIWCQTLNEVCYSTSPIAVTEPSNGHDSPDNFVRKRDERRKRIPTGTDDDRPKARGYRPRSSPRQKSTKAGNGECAKDLDVG